MTFVSFAQNFEDVMLWRALKDVPQGCYIDIGAQDPVIDSVSRAFYDAGWRGVHVEPNPEFAEKLRIQRPDETTIQALVADDVGLRKFYEIAGSGLSTARSDIAEFHRQSHGHSILEEVVPATTLDEIFGVAGKEAIHWLKVDVEGLETEVLRGWKTSTVRPWIIIIEATYPTTDRPLYEEWEQLVLVKGYTLVYQDGLNRFYLHQDHTDLADRFISPPNVFDDFQLSGTSTSLTAQLAWQYDQQLSALETERNNLLGDLEQYRANLETLREQLSQISVERKAVVEQALEQARHIWTDEHTRALELAKQAQQSHYEERLANDKKAHEVELQYAQSLLIIAKANWQETSDAVQSALEDRERNISALQSQLQESVTHTATMRQSFTGHIAVLEAQLQESAAHTAALQQSFTGHIITLEAQLHERAARIASLEVYFSSFIRELRHSLLEFIRFYRPPPRQFTSLFTRKRQQINEELFRYVELLFDSYHAPSDDTAKIPLASSTLHNRTSDTTGGQNVKTIVHIGGLIILEHEDFVRTLYYNFLGRSPDESGMQFYLYCLYKGISKEKIIYDIFHSAECKKKPDDFTGLAQILRKEARRRRFPGSVLSRISNLLGPRNSNNVIIVDNKTTGWPPAVQERSAPPAPDSVLNDISAAIEGLDQAHRDIIARIGRDEERFEKIAAQINFLTVQSRIAHPWTINALSALEGESFVSTAYKIIVQRDASEREVSYFMNLLERGEEKLKILTHLCESPEVRNLDSREDKQDSRIEYLASAIEGIDASKIGERGGKA